MRIGVIGNGCIGGVLAHALVGAALDGKLVVDATNRMGPPVANRARRSPRRRAPRPRLLYLGADREDLLDALFRVWIALAMEQGRGQRLALRVQTG